MMSRNQRSARLRLLALSVILAFLTACVASTGFTGTPTILKDAAATPFPSGPSPTTAGAVARLKAYDFPGSMIFNNGQPPYSLSQWKTNTGALEQIKTLGENLGVPSSGGTFLLAGNRLISLTDGSERTLKLSGMSENLLINHYIFSPDDNFLAYSLLETHSSTPSELHIYNLKTDEDKLIYTGPCRDYSGTICGEVHELLWLNNTTVAFTHAGVMPFVIDAIYHEDADSLTIADVNGTIIYNDSYQTPIRLERISPSNIGLVAVISREMQTEDGSKPTRKEFAGKVDDLVAGRMNMVDAQNLDCTNWTLSGDFRLAVHYADPWKVLDLESGKSKPIQMDKAVSLPQYRPAVFSPDRSMVAFYGWEVVNGVSGKPALFIISLKEDAPKVVYFTATDYLENTYLLTWLP